MSRRGTRTGDCGCGQCASLKRAGAKGNKGRDSRKRKSEGFHLYLCVDRSGYRRHLYQRARTRGISRILAPDDCSDDDDDRSLWCDPATRSTKPNPRLGLRTVPPTFVQAPSLNLLTADPFAMLRLSSSLLSRSLPLRSSLPLLSTARRTMASTPDFVSISIYFVVVFSVPFPRTSVHML